MKIIIGTRGSKLALVQAKYVQERWLLKYPQDEVQLKIIKTKGDLIQDKPLNQIGDKGLFTSEIEKSLLSGEINLAVHSMKDMPGELPEGLVFSKCWLREDARDVLVLREAKSLETLPQGAVIGTGSVRRQVQLRQLRPDLKLVDIRGNVDTRLRKMEEQQLDGIVLAAAGLKRLGMEQMITVYLEPEQMIPAPAQGVLALELCEEATEIQERLDSMSDACSHETTMVERQYLQELGGDCHLPIGASCIKVGDEYEFRGLFGRRGEIETVSVFAREKTAKQALGQALNQLRSQMAGTVSLVGAGPGDPGLITERGRELLEQADCIVYDRLIAPELLMYAKKSCEKIYVGKENRKHIMKQDKINELLVRKALQYKNVVRLKGGDPYVFGRGGEEAMYLQEHGVAYQVVPGISSALAGLAYAGIPVTHRGVSTGFHVVTAHNRLDELADIDFAAMARSEETYIFLMGLDKLGEIVHNLLQVGMKADTGVAVIAHATTAMQTTCVGALSNIEKKVQESDITSPALIVVGRVVALRDKLDFFEKKPLFGKCYLVPKIGKAESGMAKLLREEGARVREIQVGEIRFQKDFFELKQLDEATVLVFTSRNAVEGFFRQIDAMGLDTRVLAGKKIAAVGAETGRKMKKYGIRPDWIPEQYHGEALDEVLAERSQEDDVVWKVEGYTNEAVDIEEEIDLEQYDGAIFTCASSVERMMPYMKMESAECKIFSIGKSTSSMLEKYGVHTIFEALQSTYLDLVKTIMKS